MANRYGVRDRSGEAFRVFARPVAAYEARPDADSRRRRFFCRRTGCLAACLGGRLMEIHGAGEYGVTERRIGRFPLIAGAMASVVAGFPFSIRVGAGVFIGAVL